MSLDTPAESRQGSGGSLFSANATPITATTVVKLLGNRYSLNHTFRLTLTCSYGERYSITDSHFSKYLCLVLPDFKHYKHTSPYFGVVYLSSSLIPNYRC